MENDDWRLSRTELVVKYGEPVEVTCGVVDCRFCPGHVDRENAYGTFDCPNTGLPLLPFRQADDRP